MITSNQEAQRLALFQAIEKKDIEMSRLLLDYQFRDPYTIGYFLCFTGIH